MPGVVCTNNISEQALRDPAQDRRTDQTSRSLGLGGARRRTILASVLESLRMRLPQLDLRSVLNEVTEWNKSGLSCFGRILQTLGLAPRDTRRWTDWSPSRQRTRRGSEGGGVAGPHRLK